LRLCLNLRLWRRLCLLTLLPVLTRRTFNLFGRGAHTFATRVATAPAAFAAATSATFLLIGYGQDHRLYSDGLRDLLRRFGSTCDLNLLRQCRREHRTRQQSGDNYAVTHQINPRGAMPQKCRRCPCDDKCHLGADPFLNCAVSNPKGIATRF
jgi:hypothetical protein